MRTYDKSLTEVWEWKDEIYGETKGLSTEDLIKRIKEGADTALSKNRVDLVSTSLPDKRKKVA
jgi:hypothetical protein